MPEYKAPGVFVEETSFRSKPIEGVSTTTTGFVGPTRYGPLTGDPELLTSFADFERIYGGLEDLIFDGKPTTNYLAHAVRAFFEEGGQRLYVSRVASLLKKGTQADVPVPSGGYATYAIKEEQPATKEGEPLPQPLTLWLISRFVGQAGNIRLTFRLQAGTNALFPKKADSKDLLTRVQTYDLVHIQDEAKPESPGTGQAVGSSKGLHWIRWDDIHTEWVFGDGSGEKGNLNQFSQQNPKIQVRPVRVTVAVEQPNGRGFNSPVGLGTFDFDPRNPSALTSTFARIPSMRSQFLTIPFSLELPDALTNDLKDEHKAGTVALRIALALLGNHIDNLVKLNPPPSLTDLQQVYTLEGGLDSLPLGAAYEGDSAAFQHTPYEFVNDPDHPVQAWKNGLIALEGIEDISIVAAPGYSALVDEAERFTVHNALIDHCEKMRYRIAVLDTPPKQTVTDALNWRNQRSSKYAALYYPWVTIADPLSTGTLNLPPSGFIAGIYARNDIKNSVSRAPANYPIGSAIDFEQRLNKAQQEALNPEGVNCLRFFPGHGFMVWGARMISDDPEWKYVNLRRYFAYLERSLDRGLQWVMFENNSQQLWVKVRHSIEDFLFNEWKMGSLMGAKPEEAYFVRCDLSTMTQNDLDNGRLVCNVGVAPVRPAEFVIFRIGQWTANSANSVM